MAIVYYTLETFYDVYIFKTFCVVFRGRKTLCVWSLSDAGAVGLSRLNNPSRLIFFHWVGEGALSYL